MENRMLVFHWFLSTGALVKGACITSLSRFQCSRTKSIPSSVPNQNVTEMTVA